MENINCRLCKYLLDETYNWGSPLWCDLHWMDKKENTQVCSSFLTINGKTLEQLKQQEGTK